MEINSIKDVESAEYIVRDPTTNAPTDLVFTLAGPEHAQRKSLEMGRARKIRRQVQKTGKVELSDPTDDEQEQIETLLACTLGWSGMTDGGVAVPFSTAAATRLFNADGIGWLRTQLMVALAERERFINSSAPA